MNEIVLSLPHGPGNPRNSEGAFVTLADGRILYAYSRYIGEDWADEASAVIAARVSADGGRTWSAEDRILVQNEGRRNVMSVSLLRLQDGRLALFYIRKNGLQDTRLRLRTSRDEGETWSPTLCVPAPGYHVTNNDRVVQLAGGRLIVPCSQHRARAAEPRDPARFYAAFDGRGIAVFYLSDDGGRTWRESADWWAFPGKCPSGLQEPGVVELRDGRLYGWCRTEAGCQYDFYSEDGGDTWSAPRPSRFASPCSPMSIKRLPTGDLLAVWNDHGNRAHQPTDWTSSSWGRTPLALALSRDDGATWGPSKRIETDPDRGFCYTAIHPRDDAVLLAYCCGGRGSAVLQDLCVRRVGYDWLYA
jgi:hypothetical protein